MKILTAKEIYKKYKWKFLDLYRLPSWNTNENWDTLYEVRKVFKTINENTYEINSIEFYQ